MKPHKAGGSVWGQAPLGGEGSWDSLSRVVWGWAWLSHMVAVTFGGGGREADTSGRRAPIPGIAYQASTRQCLFRSNALLARTSHMAKPSVPVRGGCTRLWVLGTGDSLILHSRRGR